MAIERGAVVSFTGINRACVFSISAFLLMWLSLGDAGALTLEQAKAQCRGKLAPVVHDCVRRNVSQTGGSPAQYIPGCRQSIMSKARDCVAEAVGAGAPDPEIDLPPPSGRGRVVIVLSGVDGAVP